MNRQNIMKGKKDTAISSAIFIRSGKKDKTILFVESDNDKTSYRILIDEKVCSVIPCNGKPGVFEAIEHFYKKKKNYGMLGIVDKDYDEIYAMENADIQYESKPEIICTDENDIEMQIVMTKAFEKVINEYADENALSDFERTVGKSIFDYIVDTCYEIGCVRVVSHLKRIHSEFHDEDIRQCINNTWKLNLKKFVKLWLAGKDINTDEFIKSVTSYDKFKNEKKLLCRGHDFTEIMSCVLCGNSSGNKGFGNYKGDKMSAERIEESLRLAYSCDDLCKTKLIATIREIQKNNPEWKYLKDEYM